MSVIVLVIIAVVVSALTAMAARSKRSSTAQLTSDTFSRTIGQHGTQSKLQAIRAYRQETGVGLREAKQAVERQWLEQRRGESSSDMASSTTAVPASIDGAGAIDQVVASQYTDTPSPVIVALRQRQDIAAIKAYRELSGAGLREAKDAIGVIKERLLP